jgi:DNA replication protein DnaC
MRYIPSINIEQATFCPEDYIVTQNALRVVGNIVDSFNSGVHSFNIIGSYGTGKSNFILALEYGLQKGNALITNKGQFNGFNKFRFEKIVGDYVSLSNLLTSNLFPTRISENLFDNLEDYFKKAEKRKEFVVIIIDEFGKLLEYAAKNNMLSPASVASSL